MLRVRRSTPLSSCIRSSGCFSHNLHNIISGDERLKKCFRTHHRQYSSASRLSGRIIAIRREDQSVWERRAPLSPAHVRQLIDRHDCRVLVQPSNRRAYPTQVYASAGAEIREDISDAHAILGVKQVPVDSLIPDRTYCFFSHTIKAQPENMPLLDSVISKNIRLIDYEKMVDESGQRVVAFGKYAGVVGMINIMHGLGLRLLALGHHTPFMHIGPAHNYRNSEMARQAVRDAGYEMALGLLPRSLGALTFVFTGSGNVSQGAQEIIQELPHEYVSPDMLARVAAHGCHDKVYCCSVSRHDHLERRDGGGYDAEEYDQHPERYISTFATRIAPYMSCLVNGLYWAVNAPRVLTLPDAKRLLRPTAQPWLPSAAGAPPLPHRMIALCDISADPGGSIEFMTECTTIDSPFCLYDAELNRDAVSFRGPGVLVCSIDNMPTQLPRESTDFFGRMLMPYVADILRSDARRPLEEQQFGSVVNGAVIASNGRLTENFQYIDTLRSQNIRSRHKSSAGASTVASERRVLVLGSGYVAAPLVEYLSRAGSNTNLLVASDSQSELDSLLNSLNDIQEENQPRQAVETVLTDVSQRPERLNELVRGSNCVVSLLPYGLHPLVARVCINEGVNMVTASYCTPQMRELEEQASAAGVCIVNEVGLDPGIDHFLAMQCFDEVHSGGGRVRSFVSYCGALPAPECSENPLRYRFSWSPAGALRNSNQSARYLHEGELVDIAAGRLLHSTHSVNFLPGFSLEGFANRDSSIYGPLYGIEETDTLFRGTLRYSGYSRVVLALQQLGLLDEQPMPALHFGAPDITWKQLMCQILDLPEQIFGDNLVRTVAERVGGSEQRALAIKQLGLLSDETLVPKRTTPLMSLSAHLQQQLGYGKRERDMVVLRHNIEIEWPDRRREHRAITLVEYGQPRGFSALARTVGYPCAIAVRMLLDSEIQGSGMVLPLKPEIFGPLLRRLELEHISATQTSHFIS